MTSENLSIRQFELLPEDPYLAYWTKNLSPIYGKKTYDLFKEKNQKWLTSYGLHFDDSRLKHMYVEEEGRLKRFMEWLFKGYLGDLLESLLKKTFKKRTLKRASHLGSEASVIVNDGVLKFHNHDRRKEYYQKWLEKLAL